MDVSEAKKDFMGRWYGALEALGTPGDFAKKSRVLWYPSSTHQGKGLIQVITDKGGYARRSELIARDKQEAEQRKARGEGARWENDGSSCMLCSPIGQAKDIGNNLVVPYGAYENYCWIPNKFPALDGHGLIVAKRHDAEGVGKVRQMRDTGYLEMIDDIAREHDLLVARNHKDAGMSCGEHEHSHVFPRELFNKLDLGDTIWDICGFTRNNVGRLYDTMQKLEDEGRIFTFCHTGKIFFLTPHLRKVEKEERKGTGAGAPEALNIDFFGSEEEAFKSYSEYVKFFTGVFPKQGEFDWGRYAN